MILRPKRNSCRAVVKLFISRISALAHDFPLVDIAQINAAIRILCGARIGVFVNHGIPLVKLVVDFLVLNEFYIANRKIFSPFEIGKTNLRRRLLAVDFDAVCR